MNAKNPPVPQFATNDDPDDNRDFVRRPGLFRSWEIEQILAPGVVFRLEGAGRTEDGGDLYFVFECTETEFGEA